MCRRELDALYRRSVSGELQPPVLTDYTWAEKAYKGELTVSELAWLSAVISARRSGIPLT
ncbi:hypothetical protein ACFQWB_05675 [Paenibacillus thermoaerophilus]|uniref:Uncharacterized protein n=1 Tax=Paenibacillus thermoaerophilus TaxID=1215385 RepID=A0ABW2UZW5_9BACL|nr:hypothetical protein [Paenibacillus thermoaerophilus]TMV18296.1 hypothetical protein FE781_04980 [Paenibacillus thermoaerophilus]